MKIINLSNGKVKLLPDEGKLLYCDLDKKEHSEAIVDQEYIKYFSEVEV